MPKLGFVRCLATTAASPCIGAVLLSFSLSGVSTAERSLSQSESFEATPLVVRVEHGTVHATAAAGTPVIGRDVIAGDLPNATIQDRMKLQFPVRRPSGRILFLVTLFAVLGGRELFGRR